MRKQNYVLKWIKKGIHLTLLVCRAELRIKRTPCVSRISKKSAGNAPITGRLSLPPMSPHLTCQIDVQPATIGIRMYRKVQESRLVGGALSRSWAAQNISIVTLTMGSYALNVSVRTMALIAGDTSQQQYSADSQITYSMMIAGFASTPLSGLYAFCVQGGRELPNICQLPVSVIWSPSDVKIDDVEFVLSAAVRPSCMQSSFLNSAIPDKSLKMYQYGVVDYDDSFLTVPIPSVPPIGSHMFAQFHIEASVKSGTIQIMCKCPALTLDCLFKLS
jgi:hypothetical protein